MRLDRPSGGGMPLPAIKNTDKGQKVNNLQSSIPAVDFVKTESLPFYASDFGVEIGGSRDFEYLLPSAPAVKNLAANSAPSVASAGRCSGSGAKFALIQITTSAFAVIVRPLARLAAIRLSEAAEVDRE